MQDLVDEKISMDEMKELKLKGRPPEINSNQTATNQKPGQGVVGVGGDKPACTQPQDFDQNSSGAKVGPSPADLKKRLEHRKFLLRSAKRTKDTNLKSLRK